MEFNLKESLCMTTGDGEHSYLKTSTYVQKFVAKTMPLVDKVAHSIFVNHDISSYKVLNIADFGCSTGPNTFLLMSRVLETVSKNSNELNLPIPEIQFYLNDLPSNDFNILFKTLSTFKDDKNAKSSCFVAAVPGSFHDRVFPNKTLHFVHSSYAVNWLSKLPKIVSNQGLPLNKGNIYISKTSPPIVKSSYLSLFEQDFSLFLKTRAEEMVSNGVMLLTMQSRDSGSCDDSLYPLETLSRAISELVSEGLTDQEKLDEFNFPIYCASEGEIREVVKMQGLFEVEHSETIVVEVGGGDMWANPREVAKAFRSFSETVIAMQFGHDLMEKLYDKVEEVIASDWEKGCQLTEGICVAVVLRKKEEVI